MGDWRVWRADPGQHPLPCSELRNSAVPSCLSLPQQDGKLNRGRLGTVWLTGKCSCCAHTAQDAPYVLEGFSDNFGEVEPVVKLVSSLGLVRCVLALAAHVVFALVGSQLLTSLPIASHSPGPPSCCRRRC